MTHLKRLISTLAALAIASTCCVCLPGCGERIAATWSDGKVKEPDITEDALNTCAYYGYTDDPTSWRDFITGREYDDSEDGDETVYYTYDESTGEYTPIHGHDIDTDDEDSDTIYRLTDAGKYKVVKDYETPSDDEIAAQDDDIYYLKIDEDADDELDNFTVVHGYNLEEGDEVYDLVDGEFTKMEYVTPEPEEEEDADEEDADEESTEEDAYDEDEGDEEEDGSETSGYYTETDDGEYEAVATEDLVDGETYYQMSYDSDTSFEEVTYNADEEDEDDGTLEEYRAFLIKQQIISDYVEDLIDERGIEVSEKKVEKTVEEDRAEYESGYMEGMFESILQSYGYADIESYTEYREESLLEEKLMFEVTGMDEDDEGYDESEAGELYEDWLDDLYDNMLEVDVKDPPSELDYDPDVMEDEMYTRTYYSYDEDEDEYTEYDDVIDIQDGTTVYYKNDSGGYEELDWTRTYYDYDEETDEYTAIEDTSELEDDTVVWLRNSDGEYEEMTWGESMYAEAEEAADVDEAYEEVEEAEDAEE